MTEGGKRVPSGTLPRERSWIRIAAFGVDLIVLAGVPLLLATAIVFGLLVATPDPPAAAVDGFRAAQVVFGLLLLCRDAGGASPGKRLFGLYLVRTDGRPVGVLTSIVRNLPLLMPVWNLVEAASVLRRGDGRRPGDRAARTVLLEP